MAASLQGRVLQEFLHLIPSNQRQLPQQESEIRPWLPSFRTHHRAHPQTNPARTLNLC